MIISLLSRFVREIDPRLLAKCAWNMGRGGMKSVRAFEKRSRRGEYFPAFLFISVTSQCNLRCQGCWVSSDSKQALEPESLDMIIREAKNRECRFFGILGGEPLMYPRLIEILERHPDCYFQVFTNGTLLTDAVAAGFRRLGNVTPLISLEGLEEVSDHRRGGARVFQRSLQGLENCRRQRLLTGVATSVCKSNFRDLVNEDFARDLGKRGAHYLWYYIYRPVGPNPCPELCLSEDEIVELRRFIVDVRMRVPIMVVDAYWDHEGRALCPAATGISHHIGPGGDIEPCPPLQFARERLSNGADITRLVEDSTFLEAFRKFSSSQTRGCVLLDCPEKLHEFLLAQQARDSFRTMERVRGTRPDAAPPRTSFARPRGARKTLGVSLCKETLVLWVWSLWLISIPALTQPPAPAGDSPRVRQRVPPEKSVREKLRLLAADRVKRHQLVPPLTLDELRIHAEQILENIGADESYLHFTTVMVGNETWRETLAAIPYERRVLLLPQCLRKRSHCRAEIDDVGLLCEGCGSCAIGKFQAIAEALDCVTLVAEGTTVVTRLLEQGRVDAVIGVSCLDVLERAFPHAAAHAIPGIAIPLYRAGCDNTAFDEDWLEDALKMRGAERWAGRVDIDRLRTEVDSWFHPERLGELMGSSGTFTERESHAWLATQGKRWRPLLAVCAYQTLSGSSEEEPIPENVRKVAVATECFHKASLLHDDIEDGDDFRYGQPTPARRLGMPIALNLGDHLIGEGYRLLAQSGFSAPQQARMLRAAAEGHRSLCLGQGAELRMLRENSRLTTAQVVDIFRQKTAPAFEVALRLGAICANADEALEQSLRHFSEALGVAFQIRDDLEDQEDGAEAGDHDTRASIIQSLAWEHAHEDATDTGTELPSTAWAEDKARQLLEHHRSEAIRSLSGLQNSQLKGLLRRLVGRVIGPGPTKPVG